MKIAKIGTIIHGTLSTADLIEEFISELEYLENKNVENLRENYETDKYDTWKEYVEKQPEESAEFLEKLMDLLDGHAPDYCYFGAHQGDRSDFGFWIDWYHIEMNLHDGSLIEADEPPDEPQFDENGYPIPVLVENDHGNTTLYVWKHIAKEIWSIV